MPGRSLVVLFLITGVLSVLACSKPEDSHLKKREKMVSVIAGAGVKDPRVQKAMKKVPRHKFVPKELENLAYKNSPLPIGEGQTISQPFIVGYMTQALNPKPTDKVLEIGTGSGYQAAILAELSKSVYTIEIVESLGVRAKDVISELGYDNIFVRIGDGYRGWPEEAPFDAIMVTAAPDRIPQPLIDQLKEGGKMVVPVGKEQQELILLQKEAGEMVEQKLIPVVFVEMTGEAKK